MTRLKFVGDLPLWLGLLLSFLVAVMAWRYYRRESTELSTRLHWLLPALRATAFFLGIMILTGPALHHQQTIGEPGRVKIYVDASRSMGVLDRHVSTGRKLLIARQQGWLDDEQVNLDLFGQADSLRQATQRAVTSIQNPSVTSADISKHRDAVLKIIRDTLSEVADHDIPSSPNAAALQSALTQLEAIDVESPRSTDAAAAAELAAVCLSLKPVELQLVKDFEAGVQRLVDSNNSSVQAALEMFDQTSRWRRAERSLLETSDALFESLRKHHNVEVLALQDQLAVELLDAQATEAAPSQLQKSPNAPTTDLASGISATQQATRRSEETESLEQLSSATKPNTAIVLLTDGQHNSGPSPLQAARVLGSQGVAFYPVSLGATQQAPDLAVTGLEHPEMVFRKDRVRGTMLVRDRMPSGQAFTASVAHNGDVIWKKQLLTEGTGDRRVDFEFDIEELVEQLDQQFDANVKQHAVSVELTASVSPLPNEAETNNNERPLRFAAVTQSYRLLIIDGRSRWETRYLRNAFQRDSQWTVTSVIAGPGTDDATLPRGEGKGDFPETRDALFRYDFIIFGEVVSELFTAREYEWIRQFAEIRGGGIVFIDGQRGRLRNFTNQNLGPLLPVDWESATVNTLPKMLQLTDVGRRLPALSFEANSQSNDQFWTELPPPRTLNAVSAVPGAEVLVEAVVDGKAMPMMVTRNYGSGRILYLASDETWRWRYKAADTYHQRIWNQLAKYVMPRPFTASDEYLAIDTGPVCYDSGDSAAIRIRLTGLDGRPAASSTVDALLWKQGRVVATVSLSADPDVPGMYRGRSGSLIAGDYEVSIRASGFSAQALKAKGRFVVMSTESGELTETACNEELLQQMAVESGGAYLREEQIGDLAGLLSPLSNGEIVGFTTVLWQSYWWFTAMLLLLTLEWFLRKRAGLL